MIKKILSLRTKNKIKANLTKNILPIAVGTYFFLLIGAFIGIIPFFKGCYYYGLYYSTCGMMYTPTSGLKGFFETVRPQLFYPYGAHLMETYGLSFITYPMIKLGISAIDATKTGFFICYTISYITLFKLVSKLCKNKYIALVYTMLFYLIPVFRVATRMEPPTYLGIMAIPVSLMLDYYLWENWEKKLKSFRLRNMVLIAFFTIIRLYVVSFSWYIAIISACISCGFFLFFLFFNFKKELLNNAKRYFLYVLVPWFVAMLCLVMITPRETSEFAETTEYMNALSIDLVTTLAPSNEQIIAKWLPHFPSENMEYNVENEFPLSYNLVKEGYYRPGNGNVWYCGYVISLLTIIGLVSKKMRNKEMICLGCLAIVFLIISLGPGLKVGVILENSYVSIYGKYSLPLDYDILQFPWQNIFKILPFSAMRAVSRWIYGMIVVIYVSGAYHLRYLKEKRYGTMLISILLILSIVEYLPNEAKPTIYYEDTLNRLVEDTAIEIEPIVNKEGNRLVICSYNYNSNAYVVPLIMSYLNKCVTYSGAGDKSRDIAEKYQPKCVIECQRTAEPDKIVNEIKKIDDENLAEFILLPHFDVSRAVYIWPTDEKTLNKTKEISSEVVELLPENYKIIETEHYTIVKIN